MPAPVRKRRNYTTDVTTLNRIATAVRDDERILREKRERIVTELHKAMRGLMEFDAATIGEDDEAPPEEGSETEADGQEEEPSSPRAE